MTESSAFPTTFDDLSEDEQIAIAEKMADAMQVALLPQLEDDPK